jgi:hypothetical protein
LRDKAEEVAKVTMQYIQDLEEEHPQELWTMLQYSLQHIVTYLLRTYTPEETEEIAKLVDATILEAVHASAGIRFDAEKVAKEKLRLPARWKDGWVKSMVDMRNQTFQGAILDVLPRCIDTTGPSGERTRDIYNVTITEAIREGAYDQEGHMNAGLLQATTEWPFPKSMQYAWQFTRLDCAHNRRLSLYSNTED